MTLNISIKELKLWKNGEIHWALESLGTCRDVFRAGNDHIGIIPAFKPWFRPAGITAACIAVSLIHGWLIFIPCWQEFHYHQWGQKCHVHTLQNLLFWSLLKLLVFWPVLLTTQQCRLQTSSNICRPNYTKIVTSTAGHTVKHEFNVYHFAAVEPCLCNSSRLDRKPLATLHCLKHRSEHSISNPRR